MRIADGIRYLRSIRNVAEAALRFDRAARTASTGRKVELPSDGPAAHATMVAHDERLARLGVRAEVLTRALGDLEIGEGALASANDTMGRAREVAVQLSNGTLSAADRALAAGEVRALKATLASLGNTRGPNGYVFGGTRTDAPPFDAAFKFQGTELDRNVEVADGRVEAVSVNGAAAFTLTGVNGRDAFQVLEDLAVALEQNDVAGVRGSLDAIDGVAGQITQVRSDAGAKIERLRSALAFATDTTLLVATGRAAAVEADPVQAFSELTQARNAYEQSLEVTKRILSVASLASG